MFHINIQISSDKILIALKINIRYVTIIIIIILLFFYFSNSFVLILTVLKSVSRHI